MNLNNLKPAAGSVKRTIAGEAAVKLLEMVVLQVEDIMVKSHAPVILRK